MKKDKIIKVSVTGLFCALAFILTTVLKFKVGFLSFDLKDSIIAVVSLMYGPLYGVISAGLVSVIEFLSISDTGVYGLIMNFISSATFAFSCGIIYKNKRTFNGAILSVVFSVISLCTVMCLANIIITPYYMGVSGREVVALIPTLLLPFNFAKSLLNAATTILIYKPIRNILRKSGIQETNNTNKINLTKNILLFVFSLIIIILTIIFVIYKLNGSIEIFG